MWLFDLYIHKRFSPQQQSPRKCTTSAKIDNECLTPPTLCLLIWKEGLWRVENRNNRRLKVRTYWDYWCLNKSRCIVSSVFISTFFNVNLDETVNTHTHTQYTWILHVCTLDTKWQTYIRMLKTWLAEFRREYVYVYIYLHIFKQCLYTIYNSI